MVVGIVSVLRNLYVCILNTSRSFALSSKQSFIHALIPACFVGLIGCSSVPVETGGRSDPVKVRSTDSKVTNTEVSSVNKIQSNAVHSENFKIVNIDTELGKLEIKLFPDKAPIVVEKLIELIKSGYFDQEIFLESRPQLGFVITKIGTTSQVFKFEDEHNDLSSARGSIAITKSAASAAYLNNIFFGYNPQPKLEQHYTIFGQVITGLDGIEKMARGSRYKVNSFKIIE